MKSSLLADLGKSSILQLIPGIEDVLLENGLVHFYRAGAEVAKQGERIEHLVIPINHGLRLIDGPSGASVGFLKKGRSLALREAIDRSPYAYSALAEDNTTALFLPVDALVALLEQQPQLKHYLRLITRSEGVRAFRRALESAGASSSQVLDVLSHIDVRGERVLSGRVLEHREPQLCFVSSGRLRVERQESTPVTVGEGAWFGGRAVVPPHQTRYQARALSDAWIHRAALRSLRPVLERHGLLDLVYEEPVLAELWRAHDPTPTGTLSELPGTVELTPRFARRARPIDLRRMARVDRDEDSAAATLQNLATWLGVSVNPARIRAGLELAGPLSPLRLAEELEPFGLVVRARKLAPDELVGPESPLVISLGARLVLLVELADSSALLFDPARGFVRLSRVELLRISRGEAIEARVDVDPSKPESTSDPQTEEEDTARKKPSAWGAVFRSVERHRGLLFNLLGLSLLQLGIQLLGPLFMRAILDDVLALGAFDLVLGFIAGLILATGFGALATFARGLIAGEIAVRVDGEITERLYRRALALSNRFFEGRKVGDMLARLEEVSTLREIASAGTISTIVDAGGMLVYATVLFFFSPMIAVVAIVVVTLLVLAQLAARMGTRRLHREAFEQSKETKSLIAEVFAAMGTIKATHAEEVIRGRYEEVLVRTMQTKRRLALRIANLQLGVGGLSSIGSFGMIWLLCLSALDGSITIGSILAVSMYLQQMLAPAGRLGGLLSSFEQARVASEKVGEILAAEPEESPTRARVTHTQELRGKVRLEKVSFAYHSTSSPVLSDIDLTIFPHQVVAIVGRSGSGKTTLANLIAGLLQPVRGRIFYDDLESSMLSLPALRRQVGLVRQDYALFAGSIRDNIAFGDDAPNQERLEYVSELANVEEFISTFPLGFDHPLAAGGLGLSGGQKQRLAIARALYAQPRVLLMDEALSSLDADSEEAIAANLKEISADRTTVIIAHRLSTVRHADRILVIDDGRIVEDGDHRALLQRGGYYAKLFAGQLAEGGEL